MHELLQRRRRDDGLDRGAEFPGCLPMSADLPKPDYARNMRLVGHSDQGGRPDGVQIMVHRGYAYVGHMFSKGFSDRRRARSEEPARGELSRRAARHLEHPPADPRRPAAGHQRQGHVRRRRVRRREGLLQGPARQGGRHGRQRSRTRRATGPRGSRSTTSPSRRRRAASASCRSRAAASIASGTPADAGPTSRRCSTASPTTSS